MKIQKIKFMRIRSVQQTSSKFQVRLGPNKLLKYKLVYNIHKIIFNSRSLTYHRLVNMEDICLPHIKIKRAEYSGNCECYRDSNWTTQCLNSRYQSQSLNSRFLPVLFPDCATEIRPRSIVKKQAIKSTSITICDVEYVSERT